MEHGGWNFICETFGISWSLYQGMLVARSFFLLLRILPSFWSVNVFLFSGAGSTVFQATAVWARGQVGESARCTVMIGGEPLHGEHVAYKGMILIRMGAGAWKVLLRYTTPA